MTHQLFLASTETLAAARVGAEFELAGDEGRHAVTVVRLRAGQRCYVADGAGRRVLIEIDAAERATVRGRVLEVADEAVVGPRFVLAQALAKGDRDEQAVEAATELGVDAVVPWQAERSVVVWRGDRATKSLAKWQAVVTRASKQSRRARIPVVEPAVDTKGLGGIVARSQVALVLHEDATEPLAAVQLPQDGDLLVIVGPEGGITERELTLLTDAGARPVRLGSTILRSSSAGPAALAVLSAHTRWR